MPHIAPSLPNHGRPEWHYFAVTVDSDAHEASFGKNDIAAWNSAAHVEAPPKKKVPPTR